MRKLMTFIAAFVIANPVFSQVTIQGKVKDTRGKAVPGASVSLKDTYDGTVADSLGKYKFSTTEKGEQTLLVSNIGYKSFEQKITIGASPMTIDAAIKE